MKTTLILLPLSLLLGASAARAGHFYLEGALGSGDSSGQDEVSAGFASGGATGVSSVARADGATWKLQAGYRLTDYLAVEGGYFDLGGAAYRVAADQLDADVALAIEGWNLNALGIWPWGERFSLLGKVGAARAVMQADSTLTLAGMTLDPLHQRGVASGFFYGLGLGYRLTEAFSLRGEYEVYAKVGGGDFVGESRACAWFLGLAWGF
jgi:OOP family OmpA-OmpF porin